MSEQTELQPFQQRVVNEKIELDGEIEKLVVFLNSDNIHKVIDVTEEYRLKFQLSTMRTYSLILSARIKEFYK